MTLYSYIVKHDTGFAPNPFFEYCTLACCKPGIRKHAKEGDWIVGLTPKAQGNRIVYFMKVDEKLTFDKYWKRFKRKRPNLKGGSKKKNGDNIYEPSEVHSRKYHQLPSNHSNGNRENRKRKNRDLDGECVLVSTTFVYFGSKAIPLPPELPELHDLIVGRGYRCHFKPEVLNAFRYFVSTQNQVSRIQAPPRCWPQGDKSWKRESCGKL